MAFETGILLLVILAVIIVYLILKTAKFFIVNTVLGLIILALSNIVLKSGIAYSATAILVCAIGGIPGAILVILLHVLGVAF
ncbi:SigmaK-factor processing regulatory protein BofA [uncultured archaeon]|nr:SigmaK-factor processing regulatory protein BofA [uncultured archaeon]